MALGPPQKSPTTGYEQASPSGLCPAAPRGKGTQSLPLPPLVACLVTRGSGDASLIRQEELCGWKVILGAGREAPALCSPCLG